MEIGMIGPTVGQAMDQIRIAVKVENDRLVDGEEAIKI
jgi:hypothetical protein